MAKFIVTGCAGFIGSHLTEELIRSGHTVYGVDNLSTGSYQNMAAFKNNPHFHFFGCKIDRNIDFFVREAPGVDAIFHLEATYRYYEEYYNAQAN